MTKFKKPIVLFAISLTLLGLAGCASFNKKPKLNALQIQAMQTRTFNVNKRVAFNAVVTVFQNLGYIVQTANYDTGFITAQSPKNTDFFGNAYCTKTTAFITERSTKSTNIRVNFVDNNSHTTNKGQLITNDTPVENGQSYINAFNKIRQQIFVSTGINPPAPKTKSATPTTAAK